MTIQEVSSIISVIRSTYPNMYNKMSNQDFVEMAKVWAAVLEDLTFPQATDALKEYMRNDTKGFPPVPGQIIEAARKIENQRKWGELEAKLLNKPTIGQLRNVALETKD